MCQRGDVASQRRKCSTDATTVGLVAGGALRRIGARTQRNSHRYRGGRLRLCTGAGEEYERKSMREPRPQ